MRGVPDGKYEGHAYSYVHRFCMTDGAVPIVPVFLNAYFPPNQPTPARCFALGEALAEAVAAFPGDRRVGIMASGGLSHFVVDEAFDRALLDALRRKDAAFFRTAPLAKLQSGSSEIRNWICVAGAAGALDLAWSGYAPGYRTPALTGTGLAFASFGRSGRRQAEAVGWGTPPPLEGADGGEGSPVRPPATPPPTSPLRLKPSRGGGSHHLFCGFVQVYSAAANDSRCPRWWRSTSMPDHHQIADVEHHAGAERRRVVAEMIVQRAGQPASDTPCRTSR